VKSLQHLLNNNRRWATKIVEKDPEFFSRLARQQSPRYLWIGCSDSRVPANEIVGLPPGELFVHRNVANIVVHTDLNCLSVMQFAVDVLKVEHIIVCGHYGCSGVRSALSNHRLGLSDNWLRHVQDVRERYEGNLSELALHTHTDRENRLCELNVIEQVTNVCQTSIIQDAWERRQPLQVHGWIYGLQNGLVRDLHYTVAEPGAMRKTYAQAVGELLAPGDSTDSR
jgi:carbonic anhydrase